MATIGAVPRTLKAKPRPPCRGPRRGVPASRQLRADERAGGGGGRQAVRQPAQRCGGQSAPEGPLDHGARDLSFWVYQLGEVTGGPAFASHTESLDFLRDAGLPVNPEVRVYDSLDDVAAHCQHWEDHRHDLGYEIDGVVVKVDDVEQRSRLGSTRRGGRSPTSSRPRSARRCCTTSRCRSGAPAGRRRSPCSSRCSSAGRRSAWPRCTTRTRCAPRTCGRATP